MGLIRPATPGFIVTLGATALLAVVSFSVPYFKSIFFLEASLAVEGLNGTITFGTLGYCLEISGQQTNCSSPSIGYSLDINQLVGNDLPIDIPNIAIKWLTTALVTHIAGLILSAISALFGLLAHVREMSMAYCSTCVSGFAAAVTLLAFIFDLAFFFIAKSRINAVKGGSATIGTAIWMTLAAWILLFFSGCFYGIGRCCIRNRPRAPRDDNNKWNPPAGGGMMGGSGTDRYGEQMRLDAVKAEADRKAAQKRGEVGLPAFDEYDPSQPLNPNKVTFAVVDGNRVVTEEEHQANQQPYRDEAPRQYAGGYAQAPVGTRAVDEYHNPTPQRQQSNPTTYPPQQRRQGSGHSGYSAYTNTGYAAPAPPVPALSPHMTPMGGAAAMAGTAAAGQYLAAGGYGHNSYASNGAYGHGADRTTYHSAHSQEPTQYYDAYGGQSGHAQNPTQYHDAYGGHTQNPTQYHDAYDGGAAALGVPAGGSSYNPYAPPQSHSPSVYSHTSTPPPQDRQYSLGGAGYGANVVPDHTAYGQPSPALPSPQYGLAMGGASSPPVSPVRGPRSPPPRSMMTSPDVYEEQPPMYTEAGSSGGHIQHPPGGWGNEKR